MAKITLVLCLSVSCLFLLAPGESSAGPVCRPNRLAGTDKLNLGLATKGYNLALADPYAAGGDTGFASRLHLYASVLALLS